MVRSACSVLRGEWRLRLRDALEFARYAVEHAVDELHRLGCGKAAGDFQRLIDDDRGSRLRISEHFGYAGAKNVAVHGGHAVHPPVFGVLLDELIDFRSAPGARPKNGFGEAADLVGDVGALGPEGLADLIGRLLRHVGLKKHLQRELAGFAAGAHAFDSNSDWRRGIWSSVVGRRLKAKPKKQLN